MKSLPENMVATQVIRQSGSPGSLHVFELSHERAVDKKLLLLVEIEVSDKDNEGIVEDIAREIEQEFFNAPTKETEYAFENALAKANIRVKDTLLVKPKNWLNRMHVIVLALAGPEAYLASVGMVHAFLVHREKIVDVLRSPDGHAAPPNPLKLFTNIVSGKLGPETAMVLANESVLDYLSVERIRKCAQEFDAQEAAEALTELLAQAPSNKQFGLAVVSPLPRPLPETVIPDRPLRAPLTRQYAPFEPAYGRYGEEEEADAYPSGAPEEPYERFDSSGRATRALLGTLLVASQAALTVLLSLLAKLLEGLQLLIKRTGPALASFARATLATVRNAESRTYFLRRVKDAAGNAAYRAMHAPSRKRQLAGAAVAVLAVVFVASVLLRASKQNREQASTDFQAGISEIEQKIGEAEASLIYGNKIKSQTVLAEAQASLAALAHEFPDEEERLAAAALSIESLQNRAEKKQPITAIQVVATVIPAPIGPNEAGLVQLGDSLYFYDGIQERVASLDVRNQLLLSLALSDQGMESFSTALPLSDAEIALLARDAVLLVDASRETVAKQSFPFDPERAKPFAAYARNLYTFNPEQNQIVRYRRAGTGFTAPQNWLTGEYELATMRDISVDGFVYLIDSQGTIHVFLRGTINKTIPWPAQDLPGTSVRLYTREDLDVFYVLDPERTRIVRINKDGALETQLTSPMLEKATDLVVDGRGENLYVLAADKIYQIPIAP